MCASLVAIAICALVALYPKVGETISPLFDSIGQCVDFFDRLALLCFAAVRDWLKSASKPEPLPTLLGLAVIAAAVPVNIADYTVLSMSVPLIWPTDSPPAYLPISMILLTVILGILLHTLKGFWPKFVITPVAIALIISQVAIAWYRTEQLDEIRKMEMATSEVQAEAGIVQIAGQAPLSRGNEHPGPDEHPAAFQSVINNASANVAALLSLVLSLGSLAAIWGGTTLAGSALAWVIFFPLFASTGLLYSAIHGITTLRVHEFLRTLAVALFGALANIGTDITRTARRVMPAGWTLESFEWTRDRQNREHRLEEQRDANVALSRITALIREDLNRQQRTCSTEFVDSQRVRMNVFTELVSRAAEKAKQQLDELASHLASVWFSPLRRLFRYDRSATRAVTGDNSRSDESK